MLLQENGLFIVKAFLMKMKVVVVSMCMWQYSSSLQRRLVTLPSRSKRLVEINKSHKLRSKVMEQQFQQFNFGLLVAADCLKTTWTRDGGWVVSQLSTLVNKS